MTPPRWVDEEGRELPTRPCPRCGRVVPVHRRWWPMAGGERHVPYEDVVTRPEMALFLVRGINPDTSRDAMAVFLVRTFQLPS